ncbi:MAG: beta-propeller fold lactonase family protein [Capsulimonadales bacterium]|nr:beta-propeller fold lactonase family protein [Capsulimonadales bacterium]
MNLSIDRRGFLRSTIHLVAIGSIAVFTAGNAPAHADDGAVFTSTNSAGSNGVVMFRRANNGALTPVGTYFTGGMGTGAGLGNQGAVALSKNNRWLFVVNAGSNDISVFSVRSNGLRLVHRTPSGGVRPVSLTLHDNLLYVLNAGDRTDSTGMLPGNIAGFVVRDNGGLSPIPGSVQAVSAVNAGAAQVQFDPYGELLVVTERLTNNIDVFPVNILGVAGPAVVGHSSGAVPFGFDFDTEGRLFVTEAAGNPSNASAAGAVSSYFVSSFGILPISASIPTNQAAACWLVTRKTPGKTGLLFTGNAGAARSISAFDIAGNGKVANLGIVSGNQQGSLDLAIGGNGRFLFSLENSVGGVRSFRINNDGTLNLIGSFGALGTGFTGLAAY